MASSVFTGHLVATLWGWIDFQYINHAILMKEGRADTQYWNHLTDHMALTELIGIIPEPDVRRLQRV